MLVNLDFCTFELFDNYVISTVNQGVNICKNKSKIQTAFLLNHYKVRSYVYITNRINSYSVDPIIYKESCKINNLLGIGVVSKKVAPLLNVEIEKLFFTGKPFKAFTNIEEATNWANTLSYSLVAN